MPPRTYNATVVLPPARPPLRVVEDCTPPQLPKKLTWLSIKNASKHLNAELDGGYSVPRLYALVSSGDWIEGYHYSRQGTTKKARIRICVEAVILWAQSPKPRNAG